MPALRWDQVTEVPVATAKQEILTHLQGLGFTATSWQPFSVPSAMVEIGALVYNKFSRIAVFLKTLALNETSEDEALDRFSLSHYANDREAAVTAQRRITLACSASEGPHPIGLGDVVVSHPDGHTYRNVAGLSVTYPVVLPSGGSVTLIFEAEVPGSGASVGYNTVTQLVTTLSGVTVTSDLPERAGIDAESNVRLRARNSSKWPTLGEFELIRDLVEYIALTAAPAVQVVGIDDQNPRGAGTFDVYLAQAETTAGDPDVAAVQAALNLRVMGPGTSPNERGKAFAAPEVLLNITGTVYYRPSFAKADVEAAVEGTAGLGGALREFIRTIPLGGFDFTPGPAHVVRQDDLSAAIKSALVAGQTGAIETVVLTAPVADTVVAEFSKVRLGTVTLSYAATTNGGA